MVYISAGSVWLTRWCATLSILSTCDSWNVQDATSRANCSFPDFWPLYIRPLFRRKSARVCLQHSRRDLLLRILVAEELDAANPRRACTAEGLEPSNEAKLATSPEALAALLGRLKHSVCPAVAERIRGEALRGGIEDRHEQRVGGAVERYSGEPHGRQVLRGDGVRGGVHRDDCHGPVACGEVGDEGCPRRREDERELGCERVDDGLLFVRESKEQVGAF